MTALHFVYVSNLKLANMRVHLRVELGGHDVALQDQARRYEKSIRNAAKMTALIDEAFVYNNDALNGHRLIAEYTGGKLITEPTNSPDWLPQVTPGTGMN